jgi:hypothetical protein
MRFTGRKKKKDIDENQAHTSICKHSQLQQKPLIFLFKL